MNIDGFELEKTCGACPEAYDVFKDDKYVGYLRLRNGYFQAVLQKPERKTVYSAHPNGDGIFDSDERDQHLTAAITAMKQALASHAATTVTIQTQQVISTQTEIDLPDGKTWGDVESWDVKWGALKIAWKNGDTTRHELNEVEPAEIGEMARPDQVKIKADDELIDSHEEQ